jgi:ABC-type transport system involved in multi-copper enzyme maturation permease subunit
MRKAARIWPLRIARAPSLETNPILWYETRRKQPTTWIRALIRLYYALAILFSMFAIDDCSQPRTVHHPYLSGYVVAFQVVIGLPIILISAATAVVEERTRGSLDALLATPLSTRQIALAKWWGAFENLPKTLLLPMLVAIAAAWPNGSWLFAGCLGLEIVSAAAVWASIGLGISTWVPRLSRAIALAVALYALVSLAWPALAMTLFSNEGAGLSAISPFYGCFDLTVVLFDRSYTDGAYRWIPFWIASQAVVAVGLLVAILATFDRCLGRIRG